jgi:hypothetical protein
MPSGGPRSRSGPPPDPTALRRDRKTDAEWTTLPDEGKRVKELDEDATLTFYERELALWANLWRRPQAAMWAKLGLEYEVAAYVRTYLQSNEPEAVAAMKTAALRMAAELGLSLPGLHSLRWKIAEAQHQEGVSPRSTQGGGRCLAP